jgi:hypothetical protein
MTTKECATFYFNFFMLGLLCDQAAFSFHDAAGAIETERDQQPKDFFKAFHEALASADFVIFHNVLVTLPQTHPALLFAKKYLDMFFEIDNSTFLKFGEASVLFAISETVRAGAPVTPAMQTYIGQTAAVLTDSTKEVEAYLAAINPALARLPNRTPDTPSQNISEVFPDSTAADYPLTPDMIAGIERVYGSDSGTYITALSKELGVVKNILDNIN